MRRAGQTLRDQIGLGENLLVPESNWLVLRENTEDMKQVGGKQTILQDLPPSLCLCQ